MTTAEIAPQPSGTEVGALHMIRADLDIREFNRWAGSRGLIGRGTFDEGLAMHCLLSESFGELAPRPFRVIVPRGQRRRTGTLYGYSEGTADDLRDAASTYCDPLQAKVLPCSEIDSKPMPTMWRVGQRLGFETLVRPVIRRARGPDRPGREIDAFQAEAELHPVGGMRHSREDVYMEWLRRRLTDNGAHLEVARLHSFERKRSMRKRGGATFDGPHAVLRGNLTIVHSPAFSQTLAHGVGRHKAYGYGMLLLRPASA